jgi:hypothetical protein
VGMGIEAAMGEDVKVRRWVGVVRRGDKEVIVRLNELNMSDEPRRVGGLISTDFDWI